MYRNRAILTESYYRQTICIMNKIYLSGGSFQSEFGRGYTIKMSGCDEVRGPAVLTKPTVYNQLSAPSCVRHRLPASSYELVTFSGPSCYNHLLPASIYPVDLVVRSGGVTGDGSFLDQREHR